MTKSEALAKFVRRLDFHVGHMVDRDIFMRQVQRILDGGFMVFQFGDSRNGATVYVDIDEETKISWTCTERMKAQAEEAMQHYRKALDFLTAIEILRQDCLAEVTS